VRQPILRHLSPLRFLAQATYAKCASAACWDGIARSRTLAPALEKSPSEHGNVHGGEDLRSSLLQAEARGVCFLHILVRLSNFCEAGSSPRDRLETVAAEITW
jgi:hypothetical protein